MNNKNIPIILLLCMIFAACGEDRRKEYAEKTAQDQWIDSLMRENYYWYEDILSSKKLNYFSAPATFFRSLLTKTDGASYIEDPTDTESLKSYGILFDASLRYNNDTAYAVRVLHIDSDSPAYDAGIERGDWLIKRNGRYITKTRVDSLYKGDAITLMRGEYTNIEDENGNETFTFVEQGEEIRMAAARVTSDHPINAWGIYQTDSGTKVGYLAYSSFASGKGGNDFTYDNELRSISNSFSEQNITEFILDLRYNAGGDLKAAQLLGSILVNQEALGKTMCHLEYNNKNTSRNETLLFSNEILDGGSNLNMKKLYIITGSVTASTSDVLVNTLSPYMEKIVLVGATTKGNHMGTHAYGNGKYAHVLHPVDHLIYNSDNHMPNSGYSPTHAFSDQNFVTIYPLGDPNEIVLYSTLFLIETGAMPDFTSTNARKALEPDTANYVQIQSLSR